MDNESIVVCGTGIVGLAAALGLSKAGFNTTLLGPKQSLPASSLEYWHPRVYALSPSARAFLDSLGVWRLLDPHRITAVEAMEVYGDAQGRVDLHAWQAAQPALAWIVESGELERVLQQAIQVYGLAWHNDIFSSLHKTVLKTQAGQNIEFDLLVGADGANSPVRHAAGIRHHYQPYEQQGVVCHLNAQFVHQNTALQWFTGSSVLALLPLPETSAGSQVSMVWSMPKEQAEHLMKQPDAERALYIERHIQAISNHRLGQLKVRSPVFSFPLTLERSGLVAPGIVLVGDAAHRVHPLAGQGLNLGLADVAELIRILSNKTAGRTVNDERVLARYRRSRLQPVMSMQLATDGLHRLFSSSATPLAWLRNAGMQGVNKTAFIKRLLINQAY